MHLHVVRRWIVFEKISRAAEKLATNVSESRRGFLGRLGKAALGVAGVLGGLLLLPKEAQALSSITRGCVISGYGTLNGACIDKSTGTCKTCWGCPAGYRVRFSPLYICGYHVAYMYPCSCP
jgi:hypothetical protein